MCTSSVLRHPHPVSRQRTVVSIWPPVEAETPQYHAGTRDLRHGPPPNTRFLTTLLPVRCRHCLLIGLDLKAVQASTGTARMMPLNYIHSHKASYTYCGIQAKVLLASFDISCVNETSVVAAGRVTSGITHALQTTCIKYTREYKMHCPQRKLLPPPDHHSVYLHLVQAARVNRTADPDHPRPCIMPNTGSQYKNLRLHSQASEVP